MIEYAIALQLKLAGFPQLKGEYWKNRQAGPYVQVYTGARPQKKWAYIPTTDEVWDRLPLPRVMACDLDECSALVGTHSATGATIREAVIKLFLKQH